MTGSTNNNNTSTNSTIDAALLVPDLLSIPTPLRAESLRQLEEVSSCRTSVTPATHVSSSNGGGDTSSANTSRAGRTSGACDDTDDQSRASGSDLTPPTTTDESDEEDNSSLATDETATKKACELMTYTYHSLYKMNVSGLRFFTVYGPRGRPDMAPFKFVDRIFNLGNGSPYRLSDFIGLVEKNVGKSALIKILPDQPGDVPRTCANISKAQELLGYQPKVSFEEGIARTVDWYKGWRAEKEAVEARKKNEGVEEEMTKKGLREGQGVAGMKNGGRLAKVASTISVFSQGGLSG
eukprot:evm.model.NODE_9431_length_13702_cov_18.337761.5